MKPEGGFARDFENMGRQRGEWDDAPSEVDRLKSRIADLELSRDHVYRENERLRARLDEATEIMRKLT